MNVMSFWKRVFIVVFLLSLFVNGCGPEQVILGTSATQEPEQTAAVVPTDTAVPTDTPVPTATATTAPTATPKPTFTATPNHKATAQAEATATIDALLKQIEPDLTIYGFTPADGHLIWFNEEEEEITVEDYNTSRFRPLDAPASGNFIIQTNITWNTTGGLAGCGLFFRMDEEDDGPSNQFEMMRLQSAPAWSISYYEWSQWQRYLASWVDSASIIDENASTNKVALVVNGRNIYPYINGTKQRLVEDITLTEGLFAISATQESGVSTCIFDDTWIWEIDPQ
jgi:hypothetical protein